ncbi:MAG: U32 family peptidase [Candidatus Dadabacteria bacterium]|nr:MAG: U32 family peptidase [Candidatus Dadabacteria bacterium]
MNKPEILAPAGNIEKLKVAVLYGADAVYLGGQKYGLRARSDNFSDHELKKAVEFAHQHGAAVYVTLNAMLHDHDMSGLEDYCKFLESISVDAVIVSDAGVARRVRESSALKLHLSTQASCLNSYSATVWKELGMQRIIVGRELSIEEAGIIAYRTGLEIEMFVHGSMCMAYSGLCTISNYTAGRDSNRGGCIQSCRFPYTVHYENEGNKLVNNNFISSKDLCGVEYIPHFFKHGIHSLKIEGRMRSSQYVATTVSVYRKLVDSYARGNWSEELITNAKNELLSFSHRDYCSGSLDKPAGADTVYQQETSPAVATHNYTAIVVEKSSNFLALRLFRPLAGDTPLEFMLQGGETIRFTPKRLLDASHNEIEQAGQESILLIERCELLKAVTPFTVVRTARSISAKKAA